MLNTLWYHHEFPCSFFPMSRAGTFAVFAKCDRSVTGPPITVFRARDTAVPPRCTDHVNPRCPAPANRGTIQDVPPCKPRGFFRVGSSRMFQAGPPQVHRPGSFGMFRTINRTGLFTPVHSGCAALIHLGYTGKFIQNVPKFYPPRTFQEHHNTIPTLDLVIGLVSRSMPTAL